MQRRSDQHTNPLNGAKTLRRNADSPRFRQSDLPSVSRVLQDFPLGRATYHLEDGPLDTPCWIWQGSLNPNGYPGRVVNHQRLIVHRAVLAAVEGRPLTQDEDGHHLCENKRCVNPDHLQRLTSEEHSRLHRGGPSIFDDAVAVLAARPGLGPAEVSRLTGHSHKSVAVTLWRAARTGRLRRIAVGQYALAEDAA